MWPSREFAHEQRAREPLFFPAASPPDGVDRDAAGANSSLLACGCPDVVDQSALAHFLSVLPLQRRQFDRGNRPCARWKKPVENKVEYGEAARRSTVDEQQDSSNHTDNRERNATVWYAQAEQGSRSRSSTQIRRMCISSGRTCVDYQPDRTGVRTRDPLYTAHSGALR